MLKQLSSTTGSCTPPNDSSSAGQQVVKFGKDRAMHRDVRPVKIAFKELVQQCRAKQDRFLVRGVTKEGDSQPTYFVLEAAPLDRFLRKNKEDKNFSSIERVFVSAASANEDDIDSLKVERMSRKEIVIKSSSSERDQQVGITKARNFLEKGSTLVTLNVQARGGSRRMSEE